jgi:predicted transcriptional regulator
MTETKKTDVLNVRMDPALAAEIQRIAEWRGTSASEVARELIRHGVAVERQLEAQELRRPFEYAKIQRDGDRGYLKIEAEWVWYSLRELQEIQEAQDEGYAMSMMDRR